jgi:hypothetical protein
MQKCCEHYYSSIHRLDKCEKDNEKLTKEYAILPKENTELKVRKKDSRM